MALSEEKIREYTKRLLQTRTRLLCNHGFYGLLLMHMKYAVDEETETAYTDGERIVFGTSFLETLSNKELDFVMMHEILHVVLQHCTRGEQYDGEEFNIACDIVVNSNILLENNQNLSSITLTAYGESMHLAPDGKEGHLYTAEQVYEMIQKQKKKQVKRQKGGTQFDDHTSWGQLQDTDTLRDIWNERLKTAAQAISIRDASQSCGNFPAFAKRLLGQLQQAQTDWRSILNDFVQEEITDYSFCPPDKRFDDCGFFLPDFNYKEDTVENILFMIDTSGSMSNDMITAVYAEVKGAILQFDGRLKGWLGFFDAVVIPPQPFETMDEFEIIRPIGGGGTSFQVIFEYVNEHMSTPPACIIILTDGYAPFPEEKLTAGIPVLWLLTNQNVEVPYGKVARITV